MGRVNGDALCFDCYVAHRPPGPPPEEERAQWATWVAEGGTPIVVTADAPVVSTDSLLRKVSEEE